MARRAKSAVHPIACSCKVCTPAAAGRRPEVARAATRVLFVVAAVLSIPFIVAYPSGGGGEPRRVLMKSFTWGTGSMMTGFDIEAGAIRSFERDKIVKWLPVPEEHRGAGGARKQTRRIRRRAMFRRLGNGRYLRSGIDDEGLWVGFTGGVSQIASVHQYGLRDKPSLRAKAVPYPRRELLGMTSADREDLLDALFRHLATP